MIPRWQDDPKPGKHFSRLWGRPAAAAPVEPRGIFLAAGEDSKGWPPGNLPTFLNLTVIRSLRDAEAAVFPPFGIKVDFLNCGGAGYCKCNAYALSYGWSYEHPGAVPGAIGRAGPGRHSDRNRGNDSLAVDAGQVPAARDWRCGAWRNSESLGKGALPGEKIARR